jgi:tryptophan synthase alpha chain
MSEIRKAFRRLKEQNSGALIGYITGGDPKPEHTLRIAGALITGGVDILELGIPFSDPIADGPTIQAASARALRAGTTPRMVLEMAQEIKRKLRVPIVILTYYNPILRMGLDNFLRSASSNRVDGLVVPDLPVDEADEYRKIAETYGIDTVFVATPSTSIARLTKIVACTSGFLYLVSRFGVTGARENLEHSTVQLVERFLPYTRGQIPLAVGFGISKPKHIKAIIGGGADGAIVGSAFVNIVDKNQGNIGETLKEIKEYAHELKEACRKTSRRQMIRSRSSANPPP